jgi:hypothetical protein
MMSLCFGGDHNSVGDHVQGGGAAWHHGECVAKVFTSIYTLKMGSQKVAEEATSKVSMLAQLCDMLRRM